MSADTPSRNNRSMIWLVGAVCIAPFILSFVAYFLWQPQGRVNYGDLLTSVAVPSVRLALTGGEPFDFTRVRGKWAYLTVDSGQCDEYCARKLWIMRQVRLTQGKNMERIERVWLIDDGRRPEAAILKDFDGTWNVNATGADVLAGFPADGARRDHIYLIDPLGNVVLRYPRNADPSRMRKDLERLLKVSRLG